MTTTPWLDAGQSIAVLVNDHGQWVSIEERKIVAFGPSGAKDSSRKTWKLKDLQSDGTLLTSGPGTGKTWVVPAGCLFHRDALVWLNAGEALRDVDSAKHVLRRTASSRAALSTAEALEVAARRLRETALVLEAAEAHETKEA